MRDVAPIGIGLLDAMGYGNLGDAAIQDSVIANIRKRLPDARIVGFSFAPADTAKRHGIPCFPLTRDFSAAVVGGDAVTHGLESRSRVAPALKKVPGLRALARPVMGVLREAVFLARSFKTLRGLDLLIISGGGQLGDLWGGAWGHPWNLFKFSFLAKLAGKRLYFLNVGAEALGQRLSRFFAKSAVRMADYVSFRDTESQARIRDLGVKSTSHVCADSAYGLDVSACRNGSYQRLAGPVVGINPISYCDPRIWPRRDQSVYEAYLEKLTTFCFWLLEQGYTIKLFPTSPEVDKYAIADLRERLLERSECRNQMGKNFEAAAGNVSAVLCESVEDLLREMAGCDFIVTCKYHGVIFSQLLRKPVIALGYHAKVEAAMRGVGHERYHAGIEEFGREWLVGAFCSVVRERDDLQSEEVSATAKYLEMLREQFDELFLGGERTCPEREAGSGSNVAAFELR